MPADPSLRGIRKIKDELYRTTGYNAIWYLANSGFVVRLDGAYIFLDPILNTHPRKYRPVEMKGYDPASLDNQPIEFPLLGTEIEKADTVLLTHEHVDHFHAPLIQTLSHLKPKVIAPGPCHEGLLKADIPAESILGATHGATFTLNNVTVEVQYAEHRPGSCGFLLKTRHGNIYHPGDSKFDHSHTEEICSLDVDILLLPINDTNFGVGFAALLTQILQPRVVIPCHYGFTYPPVRSQGGHPAEYVTALAARNYVLPSTDIVILKPGGKYVFV